VLVEEARTDKQSEYRRKYAAVERRTADEVELSAVELYPGDRVVTQGAAQMGAFFIPTVLKFAPESPNQRRIAVGSAEHRPVEAVIEVDGQVDLPPDRQSAASSQFAGNIARILVERGQSVTAGQLLAEVYSLELQSLQLDLIREHLALKLLDSQWESLSAGWLAESLAGCRSDHRTDRRRSK
jgi:biotin carboxyl carrier protein